MTYWDWIRVINIAVLLVLIATQVARYRAGAVKVNADLLLADPSHLPLLRMSQILLFAALVEGYVEGLVRDLPGGPRVIAPLPGLVLTLLAMHWGTARRLWLALHRRRESGSLFNS